MYELKYKAIALAAEAKAFKKHEQYETNRLHKWKVRAALGRLKAQQRGETVTGPDPKTVSSATRQGVHLHRVNNVRKEARNAFLAYGFLRGLAYREMERFSWSQPNWDRVEKLAIRYSNLTEQDVKQGFSQWRDEALNGVNPKWIETVQPGSVRKCLRFDPDWVHMQTARNVIDNPPLSGREKSSI